MAYSGGFEAAANLISSQLNISDKLIVAIDGPCASGKTTLTKFLQNKFNCNVFHIDDYFLRPEQRTQERLSVPGGNFDIERFENEVINGVLSDKAFFTRRFDCKTGALCSPIEITNTRLSVIEGVYSCHPNLQKYYDLKIFVKIPPEIQRERILSRNPTNADVFFDKWIVLEEKYFSAFSIEDGCDMSIVNF